MQVAEVIDMSEVEPCSRMVRCAVGEQGDVFNITLSDNWAEIRAALGLAPPQVVEYQWDFMEWMEALPCPSRTTFSMQPSAFAVGPHLLRVRQPSAAPPLRLAPHNAATAAPAQRPPPPCTDYGAASLAARSAASWEHYNSKNLRAPSTFASTWPAPLSSLSCFAKRITQVGANDWGGVQQVRTCAALVMNCTE
eukprot:4729849-Pyramimonas_sp.AAC.2